MNGALSPPFGPYDGPRTGGGRQWLVIPRYAYREALQSKVTLVLLVVACVIPALAIGAIYVRHNTRFLTLLGPQLAAELVLDADFFIGFLIMQSWLAFYLALWIGPPLIARDVQNNALPLYLARPLSRGRYVSGKLLVLLGPLSLITWVFGLVVVGVQVAFEPGWLGVHAREAAALVVGGGVLVIVLSLVTLAVSALVPRQWVARGMLFGGLIVLRALGGIVNELFGTDWGDVIAPSRVMAVIWSALFGHDRWFGAISDAPRVPVWSAWLAVGLLCLASVLVLHRRIRAYEVVR
jgi:ABC-type transport system involved in multi-copper enzyme maturation permease subunit